MLYYSDGQSEASGLQVDIQSFCSRFSSSGHDF